MSSYDKNCFSLNIRVMQILINKLNNDAYDIIKNCSCAKDIWDALNAIYHINNEFVHKVGNEEQNSLKEAYSPQKDVQGCEMSSMPLDGGDIQFEDEKRQNDEEHSLDAFMEMIEEQNNFKEEKTMQQGETSTTMAQKDFEVDNAKLTYSPSFDELQYCVMTCSTLKRKVWLVWKIFLSFKIKFNH